MGQWGRFLQIKHEAYPEPLNYRVSVSVRCLRVEREEVKSDLMLLNWIICWIHDEGWWVIL